MLRIGPSLHQQVDFVKNSRRHIAHIRLDGKLEAFCFGIGLEAGFYYSPYGRLKRGALFCACAVHAKTGFLYQLPRNLFDQDFRPTIERC